MQESTLLIPILGHPSAGKSTLIRILTGRHVAVGKRSGTTKKINLIPISNDVAIADFPGFGIIRRKKKSATEKTQQAIVDYLEENAQRILFGILVTDLSNIELVAEKFDQRSIIPIDFELAEFVAELSSRNTVVVGNKIDKLVDEENLDDFVKYFPKNSDYFPVSLKYKKNMEPLLVHLQTICDSMDQYDLKEFFWKY